MYGYQTCQVAEFKGESMVELVSLNKATELIHLAVQYPAMIGKHYVSPRSDDSHTNLDWDPNTGQFYTWPLPDNKGYVMLRTRDLRLSFGHSPDQIHSSLCLAGRDPGEITAWIKVQLSALSFDGSDFELDFHYDLPTYAATPTMVLTDGHRPVFELFGSMRSWGRSELLNFIEAFRNAHPLRTWPHHFDLGSYIPIEYGQNGEVIKSISVGLAIHDNFIDQPYYYLTFWSKEKLSDVKVPTLTYGAWYLDEFHGAALPIYDLWQKDSKDDILHTFLQETHQTAFTTLNVTL